MPEYLICKANHPYRFASDSLHEEMGSENYTEDYDDIFRVHKEFEDHYTGMYVVGLGFVYRFPKTSCRAVTQADLEEFSPELTEFGITIDVQEGSAIPAAEA